MGLERTSNRTWQVSVYNETGSQQRVTAIAVCGNTRSPTVKTTTVNVPVSHLTAIDYCR